MQIIIKLLVSFLVVALIGGLIGYVGFSGVNAVFTIFDGIADDTAPELILLGEIQSLSHELQLEAISYVLLFQTSATDESIQEELKEFEEINIKLDMAILNLREHEEAEEEEELVEKEFLEHITVLKTRLYDASLLIIEETGKGASSQTIETMKEELEQIEEDLHLIITSRINLEKDELERQDSIADQLSVNVSNFVVIVSVLGVLFAVMFGVVISRSISIPLVKLRNTSQEIGKGNYEIKIQPHGDDETRDLIESFNYMTKEIGKAMELKKIDKQKDEFAAMVSHELKTPLVPIQLYTEMLLKGVFGSLNDKQIKPLHAIHTNIESLNELVNDVLDVTKLELGRLVLHKKQVDVKDLLNKNMESLSIFAKEKKVALELDIKTSGKIFCDPKRINQIISNLIKNSIDFVPENIGLIKLTVEKNSKSFVFTVIDNGPGISIVNQEHLFKKFYQVDTSPTRKHGGTGLGLTICHGLVESHGGKIWFDEEHTRGSCFKFTIPVVKS